MSDIAIKSSPRAELWAGVRDTLPLIAGAIPFGIIFGATASASGLTPVAVIGMSAFVFAGSAQFIAANLVGSGATLPLIILTTLVVNLRHVLYSATLAPHVKKLSQRWLLPLGFWLTDETFAVVSARYSRADESPFKLWYYLGSAVSMYLNWQICTWLGLLLGKLLPDPSRLSLDFAMVVTFIGIVVPSIRTRPIFISVLVAGISSIMTYPLPNKLGLIITAIAGVAAGVIAESLSTSAQPAQTSSQPEADR